MRPYHQSPQTYPLITSGDLWRSTKYRPRKGGLLKTARGPGAGYVLGAIYPASSSTAQHAALAGGWRLAMAEVFIFELSRAPLGSTLTMMPVIMVTIIKVATLIMVSMVPTCGNHHDPPLNTHPTAGRRTRRVWPRRRARAWLS